MTSAAVTVEARYAQELTDEICEAAVQNCVARVGNESVVKAVAVVKTEQNDFASAVKSSPLQALYQLFKSQKFISEALEWIAYLL